MPSAANRGPNHNLLIGTLGALPLNYWRLVAGWAV